MKRLLAVVAVAVAALATAQAAPFNFTAIPDEDETKLRQRFDKVAAYLAAKTGVEVKYVPVKSYAAAVTAFRNDQVQLAWFGGLSGVQARKLVPGAEAIAQGEEDTQFVTYFVANAATGLKPTTEFPKEIAGKSFTFGEKGSTSGRLMPEFHIRKVLGHPDKAFSRVGFSGDHSRTLALVQSGAYEVGAVNFAVYEKDVKEGTVDPKKVVVLWKTPPYPDYQWTIRGDVDARWGADFKEKMRSALLTMADPDLLASFPRKKFIPAKNSEYGPIEETAKDIGLID
jgi:phosphonate transport system substrate-binding protein